jgi:GMP synthase (glutamine-hydrolysing)
VRRAPELDLPPAPEKFDRIIVSGSRTSAMEDAPWIEQLIQFVQRCVAKKVPYLGICYGHQILGRAIGGSSCVGLAERSEIGWVEIRKTQESQLFEGLPQTFYSFSQHHDEICELPQGMKHLASSNLCDIQACQVEDSPIYGIQFHPEKDPLHAVQIFTQLREKKTIKPLINSKRSHELYSSKWGETLFRNFLFNPP